MSKPYPKYDEEFKKNLVELHKNGISDKDFIYYLAMSPILRDKAIKSMVGSSGRQRVQQGVLNDTEFLAPPLEEQIEIGRTLRALDDKIANNAKINHHLAVTSATDSSPDIRRGKRVSRVSARRAFSA
ncbi:MAG: restriction endonuclease subunit S [Oscillospiraceae bacterium]|nr:restriction endonuclease subunit S [Oscillospiraceae bacterium]